MWAMHDIPNEIANAVYLYTFPDGKEYVGECRGSVRQRAIRHIYAASREYTDRKLHRHLRKFGKDFTIGIVQSGFASNADRKHAEKDVIAKRDTYQNGLNANIGGFGGWKHDPICIVDGCDKPHVAKGLCAMHRERKKRTGGIGGAAPIINRNHSDKCKVEGCSRPYSGKGYCDLHHRRWKETGDVGDVNPKFERKSRHPNDICDVDGCGGKHFRRGYCRMHYDRVRKDGDPGDAKPKRVMTPAPADGICAVDNCEREHRSKGYCVFHYRRWKNSGDPEKLIRRERGTCTIAGCIRPHKAKGRCTMHYTQYLRKMSAENNRN